MLNVFTSVHKATHRIEPFHSQFLADALDASIKGDQTLFNAVWRLAAPSGWELPGRPKVHAELHTGEGRRIDICIVDEAGPKKRVLGIEVKTSSASARSDQLEDYYRGLREKFIEAEIAVAYLTPFNRRRIGNSTVRLPTIQVYEEFKKKFPDARHLSWLDVAEIEWDGGEIWKQHQSYVRDVISSEDKLKHDGLGKHSFDEFFGEEAAGQFKEALVEMGISFGETGAEIDLTNPALDAGLLARAFEILICDGNGVVNSKKSDTFEGEQQRFTVSRHGEFHAALFGLARRFDNVWVYGKRDYSIRVAHERYGSGVSLVRSKGTDLLETGRPRRARQP